MGVDRISDCFCNIVKAKFIEYTGKVVKRHGIATQPVRVKHASWNRSNGRWNDTSLVLPKSPSTNGGILLAPERFLKDIPRVTADGFWTWAEIHEAQTLRDDLNYDLADSLSKAKRAEEARKVARARPDLALRYVEEQKTKALLPYDVEKDPKLLVGWAEVGRSAAEAMKAINQPQSQGDFLAWVESLAIEFKDQVEQTDLWKALWNDDLTKPRLEKIIQAIAGAMWVQQCKAADVDISKEPNMGRGPVDFKFSKGWAKRALLEVKRMNSTKFTHGAETQLPQYLKTEKIEGGIYLAVGFTDADFAPERVQKVRDACEALTAAKDVPIEAVFVDARPDNKVSASKMKKGT